VSAPGHAGGERLRDVCRSYPTGVVAVTAQTAEGPVGMAVNSFASVSLDPPLVLFCPARSSSTWPLIRAADGFAVNVLAAGQHEHAQRFAARGVDRFAGVPHRGGRTGAPLLDEALAVIECRVAAEHDGGDHWIVVADVLGLASLQTGPPLLFHGGRYGTPAELDALEPTTGERR